MIDFFTYGDPIFGDDFHSFSATQMQQAMRSDSSYIVQPKELKDGSDNPLFNSDHNKERNDSKQITFKLNYGNTVCRYNWRQLYENRVNCWNVLRV